MQPLDRKAIVREYYERIVGGGAVDEIARFVAPGYVVTHDPQRHPVGVAGAREHILAVRRTYPDMQLTVEQQIAEGEWVASRVTMRGTHLGEWNGIRPTGRRVEMVAVNIDRVVDGLIVEHGGAANALEPLLEIGAIVAA